MRTSPRSVYSAFRPLTAHPCAHKQAQAHPIPDTPARPRQEFRADPATVRRRDLNKYN